MKVFFGGGLNENQVPHISEAAEGSQNFELSKDSSKLIPRKPFDLDGTAPNAGDVRGILQLVKRDDTESTLIQAGATVYSWDGASAFTSVGTVNSSSKLRDAYWSLGDYLVVTDIQRLSVVKKWDGTTFSTLTTGLGTDLYARYGTVHKNRVWLFNVKTSTDTPHLMVASEFENPESYDTSVRAGSTAVVTGNEAFYMLTPDLRPINGVVEFNKELIISTEGGKLFRLTGSDGTDFKWVEYYPASNAVGTEALVNIGNDVMYMKRGGAIDLLTSTDQSSDIAADDVSRFITSSVDGLSDAIAVYDQVNQKVLFFVSSKVLVFFKDIFYGGALVDDKGEYMKLSPWSVYKTLDSAGFNTSAAKYMRRPGTKTYSVFFGASDGRVFDLNGEGADGDAGSSSIQVIRKTRFIDGRDGIDFMRHITRGSVQYRRINEVSISIELDFGDEYSTSTASVTMDGAPAGSAGVYYGGSFYYGGSVYYSQGFLFARRVSHKNFSHVGKGSGCFMTVTTESTKDYQVDHVELL